MRKRLTWGLRLSSHFDIFYPYDHICLFSLSFFLPLSHRRYHRIDGFSDEGYIKEKNKNVAWSCLSVGSYCRTKSEFQHLLFRNVGWEVLYKCHMMEFSLFNYTWKNHFFMRSCYVFIQSSLLIAVWWKGRMGGRVSDPFHPLISLSTVKKRIFLFLLAFT